MLFDGECGFCDRTVQFLLRRDRHEVLSYATLQGETGLAVKEQFSIPASLDSMLFVEDFGTDAPRLHDRSTGVLAAAGKMGGVWRWLSAARVVPKGLRDAVYEFIAKRRIVWFGRLDSCRVPRPSERARFLP